MVAADIFFTCGARGEKYICEAVLFYLSIYLIFSKYWSADKGVSLVTPPTECLTLLPKPIPFIETCLLKLNGLCNFYTTPVTLYGKTA